VKTIYLDFNNKNAVIDILDRYGEEYCLVLASKKNIKNKKKITISDDLEDMMPIPGLKILFDENKEYSSSVVGDCLVARSLDEIGNILKFFEEYDYETLDRR